MSNSQLFILWFGISVFIHIYADLTIYAQTSQTKFRIGMKVYDVDLDNQTVASSFKQWVETIKKNSTYKPFASMIVEEKVFISKEELFTEHNNNPFDFINISTQDYFQNKIKGKLIPRITANISETECKDKLLLVRYNADNNNSLDQLVNQEIIIPKGVIKDWLQLMLFEKLGKAKHKLVTLKNIQQRDNSALLSIFFKKKGYALVREAAYRIAIELNPQLKNKLFIMATSPGLIYYISAFRNDIGVEFANELVKEACSLHKTVGGKQLLDLMKVSRVYPISDKDLEETRIFYERYNQIFNKE